MSDLVKERGATRWVRPTDFDGPPKTHVSGADRLRPLPWDKGGRKVHGDAVRANEAPSRRWPPKRPDYDLTRPLHTDKRFPQPKWWPPEKPEPRTGHMLKRQPIRPGRLLSSKAISRPVDLVKGLPFGRLIRAIDLIDAMYRPNQLPGQPIRKADPLVIPAGFYLYSKCSLGPPPEWSGYIRGPRTNSPLNAPESCLSAQAIGGGPPSGEVYIDAAGIKTGNFVTLTPPFNTTTNHSFWYNYPISGGTSSRHQHYFTLRSNVNNEPVKTVGYVPYIYTDVPAPLNPNVTRNLLSVPPYNPVVADPLVEVATGSGYQTPYIGRSYTPGGVRPIRPARIRPPHKRERHSKHTGWTKTAAIVLFKVLDVVSEYSEIVGALYDSLPERIRKQYERENRGLIDSAGQYGIDGVDWKAQALYENYRYIDPQQAVYNLMNNALQDQVIGIIMQHLPPNVGRAVSDGIMTINEAMAEYLFVQPNLERI